MRAVFVGVALVVCAAPACSESECGANSVFADGQCVPVDPPPAECPEACGEHEFCDDSTATPECACVAGYSGAPCTWVGAPSDPEFTSSEVWSTSNGATILPFEAGLGAGVASLVPSVVCNGGIVSQTFDMPSYASAEPFVAEVTYRAEFVNGVGVGFGRAFKTLPVAADWTTARFCLGEAGYGPAMSGYGGPVEFQVGASERSTFCNDEPFQGTIEFDRLDIKPANEGECPEPGAVLNGDADLGGAGWVFEIEAVEGRGLAEGSLRDGVGQNQGSGAWIAKGPGQNRSSMATQLSVPLGDSNPSPALKLWWKASLGSVHVIELGTHFGPRSTNRVIGTLVGDDAEHVATYCLPPWVLGNVVELAFVPFIDDFDLTTELVVDSIELLSDARCGTSADLLDPGFDSAPNLWPGQYDFGSQTDGRSIVVRDNEALARTGRGVLEMTYSANDQNLRFEHWVLVPEPEADRGPLLRFHSKFPAASPATVYWFLGRAGDRTSVLTGGELWQPNDVCLPPQWAGRWFRVQVRIDPSREPFALVEPPLKVYLDDFALTTDELCPAR